MQKKEKVVLVWYKRDLRIRDHLPLATAREISNKKNLPLIAFYCFEPNITSAQDYSNFHRQFITDSLLDLTDSLQRIGVQFIIFERNISSALKYIQEFYDIDHIFSHEETGNSLTYRRDILMKKYLRSKQISWTEFPNNGVVRRLKSRDDWSKIWNSRMQAALIPPPESQNIFLSKLLSDPWQKD